MPNVFAIETLRSIAPRGRTALLSLGLALSSAIAAPPAAAAEQAGYLFDLEPERILALADAYRGPKAYDPDQLLEAMRAPFACKNFGDLCADIGPDYGYKVLEQAWSEALAGASPKTIEADTEALLIDLVERYVDEAYPKGLEPGDPYLGTPADEPGTPACTQRTVFDEGDGFRLRQASRAVDLGIGVTAYSTATFFKKNLAGNFRRERADRIEIEGRFFVTGPLAVEVIDRFKAKEDEKSISITFVGTSSFSNPHAEACGTVRGPTFLSACSCSGPRPEAYENF